MSQCVSVVLLLLALALPCGAAEVCMGEAPARAVLIELEACRVDRDIISSQASIVQEQRQQIDILNGVAVTLSAQVQADAVTIEERGKQVELVQSQCEAQIEAARPSLMDRLGWGGGGALLGLLFGVMLVL